MTDSKDLMENLLSVPEEFCPLTCKTVLNQRLITTYSSMAAYWTIVSPEALAQSVHKYLWVIVKSRRLVCKMGQNENLG